MKSKLRIACAALLATAATQAMALQLGQIQVKSALNQPLVAAIPLHPKNLTELDGLTVALAPAADFARAGLKLTPTDQTLRFHVVTDNNGQKLILVTSSQPITDPYLDFLVQVNTRQGKQVREFVVLLNPVIAAPAPTVQAAPVASTAVQQTQPQPQSVAPQPQPQAQPQPSQRSLEFPPPLVKPSSKPAQSSASMAASKPEPQAKPKPAAQAKPQQPAQAKPRPQTPPKPKAQPQSQAATAHRQMPQTGTTVPVAHGDTLYGIARHTTQGTDVTINQMMLALKAANPDAFFKNNINDLKAGAILRIPTRNQIDKTSVAEANAEVRRQYEAWRAAKPHPATVLAGSAARAAARSAPKPAKAAPASDHLSLVPPSGKRSGANNRPGVAGGTGSETVAGLGQQLQNDRGTLISLDQSNADLASRMHSLKKLSGKSSELLSLKDATIAELQQKLAKIQSGKAGAAAASSATKVAAGPVAAATIGSTAAKPAASTSATAHSPVASKSRANARKAAPHASRAAVQPWYEQPIAWAIAGLVILVLILAGLFTRKRRPEAPAPARGPLPDPEDVPGTAEAVQSHPGDAAGDEDALYARLAEHPDDLEAHLQLCRTCYARGDAAHFVEAAEAMHEEVADPDCAEWREVRVMGIALAPQHPLFAPHAEGAAPDDPYGLTALRQPSGAAGADDDATLVRPPVDEVPVAPVDEHDGPVRQDEPPAVHDVPTTTSESPESPFIPPSSAADEPEFSDDPVDTKLDLARAYLDMGDPVGARAMLEEVIEEGSQTQKDEAKRLLAEAGASD